MRLRVTDDAPSNLSYPYTGPLDVGDEFDVDAEKAETLLDTHDYLEEADIVLDDDEYAVIDETPVGETTSYERDYLESITKADLYDIATERDISGRSSMSKAELIDAILN
jgi:hypothetical protein